LLRLLVWICMALGRKSIEAKEPLHFVGLRRDKDVEIHGDSTTTSSLFLCVECRRYRLVNS
jgi:hypothetical protein